MWQAVLLLPRYKNLRTLWQVSCVRVISEFPKIFPSEFFFWLPILLFSLDSRRFHFLFSWSGRRFCSVGSSTLRVQRLVARGFSSGTVSSNHFIASLFTIDHRGIQIYYYLSSRLSHQLDTNASLKNSIWTTQEPQSTTSRSRSFSSGSIANLIQYARVFPRNW